MQKIFDLIEYIMQILYGSLIWRPANFLLLSGPAKGQSNSERIYEVIVSPKMQTKNYKYFCPTIQTRIVALLFCYFVVSVGSFLATILVHIVGQKSGKCLVCILGETMTS